MTVLLLLLLLLSFLQITVYKTPTTISKRLITVFKSSLFMKLKQ